YGPARAMSSISRACLDMTLLSSHAARLVRSHSAAFLASHGASSGIDLHIWPTSSKPAPRLAIAHGLIDHGIVPEYRCFLPSTIFMASPSMYCLYSLPPNSAIKA